jgi:hypothetical protein
VAPGVAVHGAAPGLAVAAARTNKSELTQGKERTTQRLVSDPKPSPESSRSPIGTTTRICRCRSQRVPSSPDCKQRPLNRLVGANATRRIQEGNH